MWETLLQIKYKVKSRQESFWWLRVSFKLQKGRIKRDGKETRREEGQVRRWWIRLKENEHVWSAEVIVELLKSVCFLQKGEVRAQMRAGEVDCQGEEIPRHQNKENVKFRWKRRMDANLRGTETFPESGGFKEMRRWAGSGGEIRWRWSRTILWPYGLNVAAENKTYAFIRLFLPSYAQVEFLLGWNFYFERYKS